MATLKLGLSNKCLGCRGFIDYPGFKSGLCFLCFESSGVDISIKDILKMFCNRNSSFHRCHQRIINFLQKYLEDNVFSKQGKTIPKGYILNFFNDKYDIYKATSGGVVESKETNRGIEILMPGANSPGVDVPILVLKITKDFEFKIE